MGANSHVAVSGRRSGANSEKGWAGLGCRGFREAASWCKQPFQGSNFSGCFQHAPAAGGHQRWDIKGALRWPVPPEGQDCRGNGPSVSGWSGVDVGQERTRRQLEREAACPRSPDPWEGGRAWSTLGAQSRNLDETRARNRPAKPGSGAPATGSNLRHGFRGTSPFSPSPFPRFEQPG